MAGNDPTTADSFVRAVARVDVGLAPGHVLEGNYQLVQRIGGGGMGVVYRALDQRLGRDVAIKVLRPGEGAQGEHLRRLFEREARTTAQLLHPNIVTLHHIGEHLGHPYLVLELLGGETVAERILRAGAMPLAEALRIFDGVLAALAYAHERGVLHRDIKPSNVFITLDHRIKVLDFGVAFSLTTAAGTATRSAGTPGYMAPEQYIGAAQDARTDLWAATRLFAECVVGRHVELQEAIGVVGGLPVPQPLAAMFARSLAMDPTYRPASVAEVRALVAGQSTAPTTQPAHPGARARTKRARWPLVVLGLAVVAAVVIAVALSQKAGDTNVTSTTINNTHDGADVTNVYAGSAGSAKPPASVPAAGTVANPEIEACKTAALAHVWVNAEQCAHKIASVDPAVSAKILEQVKRETPNEAIMKEIAPTLEKRGIDAAKALAATLSADSVYQDDAKSYINLAESLREDARRFGEEGDCDHMQKIATNKIMVYEVAHIDCKAEPDDAPCKGQDVLEDARFESNRGNAKKALGMIEGLIACTVKANRPVQPGTELRALEAACLDHDEAAAKAHYAKVAEPSQRSAIRFCHGTNIALP